MTMKPTVENPGRSYFTGTTAVLQLLLAVSALLICISANADQAVVLDYDDGTRSTTNETLITPSNPTIKADALLACDKAETWNDNQTKMLLLDGHVHVSLGTYWFRARQAVISIISDTRHEQTIRHLAIYLQQVKPLYGQSTITTEAANLLVTASTYGKVQLATDLLQPRQIPPAEPLISEAIEKINRYRNKQAGIQTQRGERQTRTTPGSIIRGEDDTLVTELTPIIAPDDVVKVSRYSDQEPSDQTTETAKSFNITTPPTKRQADEQSSENQTTDPLRQPIQPEPQESETTPESQSRTDQNQPKPLDSDNTDYIVKKNITTDQDESSEQPLIEDTGIIPTRGDMKFSFNRIVIQEEETESLVMLIGDVRLFFRTNERGFQFRQMTLKAEKAVLFINNQSIEQIADSQVDADAVRGIYLEDNVVVTDGEYTVRAPRVYYDLKLDKAVLLEAVLFTYDVKRCIPLYARAQIIRQTAVDNFTAQDAILTTSEFAEPHFSIRAAQITVSRIKRPDETATQQFTATHTTLNWGELPVFYWPYLAAESRDLPLRSVSMGYSQKNGPEIRTAWDMFALAGRNKPEGVDITGNVDYRGKHGPALGLEMDYSLIDMFGQFNSYLLPIDNGTDKLAGRRNITHDNNTRGYVHLLHRQDLTDNWQLSLEASYISDFTFLDEFDSSEAGEAKTYETSLYLKKQEDQWALTLLAKYDLTDFTPQLTTLQTPGFTVEKLPELGVYTTGWSIFDNALTWFSETRLSRIRAHFGEETPRNRGFKTNDAWDLFGIAPNMGFEQAAQNAGFPLNWIARLDSRHELNVPLKAGPLNITPYVAGRITAYDDNFEEFNNNNNDDQLRLWGAVGSRFHTQLHKIYPEIHDELLDVHSLRHIIEPSAEVFLMDTTFSTEDLPIYDQDVESLCQGYGGRIGLTNTLQTKRGGPGQWRNVDWLQLTTDVVFWQDNPNKDANIARFYGYRPEYSLGTDHFYSRLIWQLSDSLGITGDMTYGFEHDELAQWRVGCNLLHSPKLTSFIDYSEIDILDSRLLTYGFSYQLTRKYALGFSHRLDFSENESRRINLWLERRLPRWRMKLTTSYDELDGETIVGFVLVPEGLGSDFRTLAFR